ncbi:hypothetical protein [Sorangium sp. So ce1000]|uniref:hypothetical protein n=1 Tax=Sorangium sp. So ce1000 TaxID=3133325 RepID=UPI003F5E1555
MNVAGIAQLQHVPMARPGTAQTESARHHKNAIQCEQRDAASFHASNAAVPDRRLAPLRAAQHTLDVILERSRADFVRPHLGLPLRLSLHRLRPGAPAGLLGDAVAEPGTP